MCENSNLCLEIATLSRVRWLPHAVRECHSTRSLCVASFDAQTNEEVLGNQYRLQAWSGLMHPIDCRADAALQNGSLRRHKICALICAFIHFPHTSLEGPDRSLTAIDSHRPTTLLLWVESRFEKAWNLYRLWILHIQEIRNVSEPCENEDSYKNFAECIRMLILLRYSPGCLVVQSASLFWATKARVSDILSHELLTPCSSASMAEQSETRCSDAPLTRNNYHSGQGTIVLL